MSRSRSPSRPRKSAPPWAGQTAARKKAASRPPAGPPASTDDLTRDMETGDSGVDPALERAILSNDLSGIPDDRQGDVDSWEDMLKVLRTKDWDRRVRIGAGNMGGARVGSVAQVPPLGVKLALRKAMMERANAEIHALLALEELRRLRHKRAVRGWIWFASGAAISGGLAAAARYYLG